VTRVRAQVKLTHYRNLDSRQRRGLTLFETSREITARDVAALFGYRPRNAALLCQRWVEQGFLEITDPAKKSRRYKLSDTYIPVIDEID
jgi:hypothetical protein